MLDNSRARTCPKGNRRTVISLCTTEENNGMTPPLSPEMQALTDAYSALDRNDIPAFAKLLDPQIERFEFLDSPMAGTYRGLAAVTAHLSKARATWAEGTCTPERFIIAPPAGAGGGDNRIIVLVHVHVRLKTETEWREGRTADVFTFRNGKVVQFRTFAEERQAFKWAGVEPPHEG